MRHAIAALGLLSCVHAPLEPQTIYVGDLSPRLTEAAVEAANTISLATSSTPHPFAYSVVYDRAELPLGPNVISIIAVDVYTLGASPLGGVVAEEYPLGHGRRIALAGGYAQACDDKELQRILLHEYLHALGAEHVTSTPAVLCPGNAPELPCVSSVITPADITAYEAAQR